VACLALWSTPVSAAGASGLAGGGDARLEACLAAQRAAFLANDAGRLVRGFAPDVAVFVRVPPIAPAGFLAPGPLRAFVERLVAARHTVALELPMAGTSLEASGGVAHVRARWQFRAAGSDTLQTELMHLTWRDLTGDGEWAIVELKTVAR
jgi:ketosteroid isomerase-like protein